MPAAAALDGDEVTSEAMHPPHRNLQQAGTVVLDFEGVGNLVAVRDYYDGVRGPKYGISFDGVLLAAIDNDAGGSLNSANLPSPTTGTTPFGGSSSVMTVRGGFTNELAFRYSAAVPGTVTVYDGPGGTGNVLATAAIPAVGLCSTCGDPTGVYGIWTRLSLSWAGVARSARIGQNAGQVNVIFDNITLRPGCPATAGTGATFEIWDGDANARVGSLVDGGSHCLSGNWNIRAKMGHDLEGACGSVFIKFFATAGGLIRRRTEDVPMFFLHGDDPATGDVYGNTNQRPKVNPLVLVDGAEYCVRSTEGALPGFSQVCFTQRCP